MSESQSSSSAAPAPSQNDDVVVPGRKHKTTACRACKQKKLKCRGDPPCEHCVANGLECHVDEMADMRRKFAMKRKLDRLEQAEDVLMRLVSALRESETTRVAQLMNLIRSNASFAEIQAFLKQQFTQAEIEGSPELRDFQNQFTRPPSDEDSSDNDNRTGRRMLDLRRLTDIPVYRVPAKPWTTITEDDDLVSHLVSLWMTWTHPFFHWMDKDAFVRDMQSGKLDGKFCSPFLVNIILSEASYYCDYAEVFTIPNDTLSRGNHFFAEARRLLEEQGEETPASLPTMQGLMLLFLRFVEMGKDRMGWIYLDLAVRSAEEYAELRPFRESDNESIREMHSVANHTLWGIFSMASTSAVSIMKHIDVSPPQRPRIPLDHSDSRDIWLPYPKDVDPVRGHHNCVFDRWCDLSTITIDVSRTFNSVEGDSSPSELPAVVDSFYQQLQHWRVNLPPCLQVEKADVPHILSIHLFYNTIIMQIFGFIRSSKAPTTDATLASNARATCLASARRVAYLLNMHREKWGIDRMSPSTIQWLSISLFTLLEALDSPENRTAFIELCIITRSFSRRFALAKGILRMIQLSATQLEVVLPEETGALFTDFEIESWGQKDASEFSSFYPHFSSVIRQGWRTRERDLDMDAFLGKWDGFGLGEK